MSENYEQSFPNEEDKQYNAHEEHKQSFPNENYNRTFIIEAEKIVRCSILVLLEKTIRCSIRSL